MKLLRNPENKEDQLISFFPIASDSINFSLESFRPEEYSAIKVKVIENFIECFKRVRTKDVILNLSKGIKKETEDQKEWNDILFYLSEEFPKLDMDLKRVPNYNVFMKHFNEYLKKADQMNTKQ